MRAANWHCGQFDFDVTKPVIMGICNVTPDSFSDGGAHATTAEAIEHAHALIEAGADIIDVGGESTRPGSDEVPAEDELARVIDVVRALCSDGVKVSIDTRHALVAEACVRAGACIINDVSGFRSREMRDVAIRSDAGLVVMHMRGNPKTMQNAPEYDDVVTEVQRDLERMARRLEMEGVDANRICLDFGIGFGKSLTHNHELIAATERFAELGYPLMSAVSRKSFIGAVSGEIEPARRDFASSLCSAFMASMGAQVIRTHNAGLMREVLEHSHRAIVSLGSNMGNSCAHIDEALAELGQNPAVWIGIVSEYVISKAAYMENQADFVNAVAAVQTMLSPGELLRILQGIENDHGRVRDIENGPRSLDLDIVDYESVVMNDDDLVLPHPLARERDFVVTPVLSILPGYELANGIKLSHDDVRVGEVRGLARGVSI